MLILNLTGLYKRPYPLSPLELGELLMIHLMEVLILCCSKVRIYLPLIYL